MGEAGADALPVGNAGGDSSFISDQGSDSRDNDAESRGSGLVGGSEGGVESESLRQMFQGEDPGLRLALALICACVKCRLCLLPAVMPAAAGCPMPHARPSQSHQRVPPAALRH
jgi:hypothetical protein